MTDGERLADIVAAAVARGDAPGVVAAVVLTQRAADETGMPAVCDEVLSWAIASR